MSSLDPTTIATDDLAPMLRAWSGGLYPGEAAVGLLIAHGYWLHRRDFLTQLVDAVEDGWGPRGEIVPMAMVDWPQVTAFTSRAVASSGELTILRLAASLAGAVVPHSLMELTSGLDETNSRHVLDALAHRFGWHERGTTHTASGFQADADADRSSDGGSAAARLAGPSRGDMSWDGLPTFEDVRGQAYRLLGDAADWLRSDYRPGTGPCGTATDAVRQAFAAIGTAKNALNDAAHEQTRAHDARRRARHARTGDTEARHA